MFRRWRNQSQSTTQWSTEKGRAAELLKLYGQSNNDHFKLLSDKHYFFTESGNGFVAYGVSHGVAMVLGDPVAPAEEMDATIHAFVTFCKKEHLRPIFHQVSARYLDTFKQLHLHPFKSSEEAIVDLTIFSTGGPAGKNFRTMLNRMMREEIYTKFFESPVPSEMIQQARVVSDSWLESGRRERRFVLGRFEDEYVRHTPMLAAFDADGVMQAFVNIVPSYAAETATLDMMRYREGSPYGLMDFLFLKLIEYNKAQGFRYFNLGPAPIIKLPENEPISFEEKIFYRLAHHLDPVYRMSGLRNYKAKFTTGWKPLYIIHGHILDWPRVMSAFRNLTELPENQQPLLSREHRRQLWHIASGIISEWRRVRKEKQQTKKSRNLLKKLFPFSVKR